MIFQGAYIPKLNGERTCIVRGPGNEGLDDLLGWRGHLEDMLGRCQHAKWFMVCIGLIPSQGSIGLLYTPSPLAREKQMDGQR